MKKILIFIILISICLTNNSKASSNTNNTTEESEEIMTEQQSQYGIDSFINQSEKYTDEFDLYDIFKEGLTGRFDNNKILKILLKTFNNNLKESLLTISGIIIIVIINSILQSISENLGNESVSKIAFFIQYILIVTLIMKNFSDIITNTKNAILDLSSFSLILIPLLSTLIVATGNITTSSLIEPILLSLVSFISNFITSILIPIILVATALGIMSKVSSQIQIEKLSKFLKKSSVWVLTTVLGIFMGLASLESGLTSNVDNITKKAGKSIISTAVPVVGGIIGDAIDTIVGYTNIIKNAAGIVGIFVVLSICIKPIMELATLTIVYSLSSALCEPIADKKVVELIDQMSSTFKVMLAVMVTITLMVIIGLALVIRITS